MKAETAYNVIKALPEKELQRLLTMLNKKTKPVVVKKESKPMWTVEECTEKLLATYFNKNKKK